MTVAAVVDCGMGNLHSVVGGIRKVSPETKVIITDDGNKINNADKVIFPGDGNFDACMDEIDRRQLRDVLIQAAHEKPFLGICVGMQVLFAASEEGKATGLGVFNNTVRRLPAGDGRKIPHIGWNKTKRCAAHSVSDSLTNDMWLYFIHSYYAPLGAYTLISATYGVEFSAVVGNGSLIASQFHPEKSGTDGLRLLKRFICE